MRKLKEFDANSKFYYVCPGCRCLYEFKLTKKKKDLVTKYSTLTPYRYRGIVFYSHINYDENGKHEEKSGMVKFLGDHEFITSLEEGKEELIKSLNREIDSKKEHILVRDALLKEIELLPNVIEKLKHIDWNEEE